MKKDVTSGTEIFGRCRFRFVVAETAFAWHENHGSGRHR